MLIFLSRRFCSICCLFLELTITGNVSPLRRFTGGRRQNNTGAMKQLNYKYDSRPSTAPMKRGLTGSKLKNNSSRPMPFED